MLRRGEIAGLGVLRHLLFSPGRGSLPDVLALRRDAEQGMVEAVGGHNVVKESCDFFRPSDGIDEL